MKKTAKKHAKSLIVMFLAILTLASTAQPALANSVTDEIEKRLVSPRGNEDGTGWEEWNAEYESYGEMWAKYFLDLLPDSSNPEALRLLTKLPEYDNLDDTIDNAGIRAVSWRDFIGDGDEAIMRNEAYRLAKELGIDNPNWSTEQKIARLNEWYGSSYSSTWDGPPYYQGAGYSGPFKWNSLIGGHRYDCTTSAAGAVMLYRIAGVPAIMVDMRLSGVGHNEAFFYDGNTWRHPGINYGSIATFTEYYKNIDGRYVYNVNTGRNSYYMLANMGTILDINETWIDGRTESFIFELLQTPYAHPEKALTRGEVAKIVCNFLSVVPMRNEQIFSDVPVSHGYSSYIWAMNSLGIMNGVGEGNFNPNGILTMQEFAVIATRVKEYGKQQAIDLAANWRERMLYIDEFTQEELARFDAEYKEKVTLFDPPANSTPKTFKDADKVADWAKPTIDEFSKFGILEGDGNGYLNPTEQLGRTRFLVFMYKLNRQFDMFHRFGTQTLF